MFAASGAGWQFRRGRAGWQLSAGTGEGPRPGLASPQLRVLLLEPISWQTATQAAGSTLGFFPSEAENTSKS